MFLAVFMPLLVVYSVTAEWGLPYHIDALTNSITGWYVGNEGTTVADRHEVLTRPENLQNLGWFVDSPSGPVGQYPPGAALVAGLFYAFDPGGDLDVVQFQGSNRPDLPPVDVPIPPLWPATLSAVLCSALTAAVLAIVFLRTGATRVSAIAGGLVFGLATGAWAVASQQSWTHGPGMLAVALGLLAAQRDRWALGGAAFAFAILTRPHLGIVAAAVGLGVAWQRRQPRVAVVLGGTAAVGLALLVAYNAAIWHRLTISGGYGSAFRDNLVSSSPSRLAENVLGALFDGRHGLFTWAPFLLLLIAGALIARDRIPDWARWAALGGVLYLLVQLRANRFSGGDGHFAYRYPLEALTAAAPALFIGFKEWVVHRPARRRLFAAGVAIAFAGQLYGANGGIL